jgi:hypothetical protein
LRPVGGKVGLASEPVQVLATTHSPDLLNYKLIRENHLLAVSAEGGETIIGPVEEGTRSVLHDRLYAAGELLSQGPIEPDRDEVDKQLKQLKLFSDGAD